VRNQFFCGSNRKLKESSCAYPDRGYLTSEYCTYSPRWERNGSRENLGSSGTGITDHECAGVTIEWCLRERTIVVIIVTGRNKIGDCEEGDAWGNVSDSSEVAWKNVRRTRKIPL